MVYTLLRLFSDRRFRWMVLSVCVNREQGRNWTRPAIISARGIIFIYNLVARDQI